MNGPYLPEGAFSAVETVLRAAIKKEAVRNEQRFKAAAVNKAMP
jgi:hypothetical protein